MTMKWTLLALLICVLLGGCNNTTSPTLDGRPLSMRDADRQYKARLLDLTDGKTTQAEIVSVMGDPDRVTDDKKTIMYYWTVKDKDHDVVVRSFVLTTFGPNDVLVRHAQYDQEAKFGGPKLPEDALSEFLNPPAVK